MSKLRRLSLLGLLVAVLVASLAPSPSTASAAGHTYHHGRLFCDLNRVYVQGDTLRASVAPGERVRVTHSIFQWTGSSWVLAANAGSVTAVPATRWITEVSGDLSNWYRSNGTLDGDGTTDMFTVNSRGYHYAIAERIVWINSAGAVVDSHYAWVYKNTGGYYCYVR